MNGAADAVAVMTEERRRRGGRPRSAEPWQAVSVRLPAADHDALLEAAKRERSTLTELVRRAIRREFSYLQNSTPETSGRY